jgi:AcrR family transcriptional regulator
VNRSPRAAGAGRSGPERHASAPRTTWRTQRDVAARNEQAIVQAARRLFRDAGIGSVDIRQIARAAGVGVGTVYRRFHDKAGLLAAVIGQDERVLQDALLTGPPPLGPGAPAIDRLGSFLRALTNLTEDNLNALLATDLSVPGGRIRVGAYQAWRMHVSALLSELQPQLATAESGWLADVLLAPLSPDLYAHHRRERGLSTEQIAQNLLALARNLARSHTSIRTP